MKKIAYLKEPIPGDPRSIEQIFIDYEIEKELANRLRQATKEERKNLYTSVYDELFRRTPLHPQLIKKASPDMIAFRVSRQLNLIQRFLSPDTTFLEVGPGDCALSIAVANKTKQVYAVDVSTTITGNLCFPDNFSLVISDGSSIPVAENSVDVAYSNQLMEHLHLDDAYEQLQNIYRALKPGGAYICITPNRLSGPHDVSQHFDRQATGLHLKEYTTSELVDLFKSVGFKKVSCYVGAKGKFIRTSPLFSIILEAVLEFLPYRLMTSLSHKRLRTILGINIVGIK